MVKSQGLVHIESRHVSIRRTHMKKLLVGASVIALASIAPLALADDTDQSAATPDASQTAPAATDDQSTTDATTDATKTNGTTDQQTDATAMPDATDTTDDSTSTD